MRTDVCSVHNRDKLSLRGLSLPHEDSGDKVKLDVKFKITERKMMTGIAIYHSQPLRQLLSPYCTPECQPHADGQCGSRGVLQMQYIPRTGRGSPP
jgi:hypothetical protein